MCTSRTCLTHGFFSDSFLKSTTFFSVFRVSLVHIVFGWISLSFLPVINKICDLNPGVVGLSTALVFVIGFHPEE